jgi:hypothetical protein
VRRHKRGGCTYGEGVPDHLAIHKLVTDIPLDQSTSRCELHLKQTIGERPVPAQLRLSVIMERSWGKRMYLPFHKNTTKETRLNAMWVDSMLVIQSQILRRLSEEGASGQAFDMALFLSRV